jgi:hypothetical protein
MPDAAKLLNTVTVSVLDDPALPSRRVQNIPWYAGITALQAMILADAITEPAGHRGAPDYRHDVDFSFRVTYSSMFGAFVDQIGGIANGNGKFWLLYVFRDGTPPLESPVGVSEALLLEDAAGQTVVVEWRLQAPSDKASSKRTVQLTAELTK